jgi:hypothetical protein
VWTTFSGQDGLRLAPLSGYLVTGIGPNTEVLDTVTGLSWRQTAEAAQSFGSGLQYCAALGGGFRLPTVHEQFMLADLGAPGPVLSSSFTTSGDVLWTQTTALNGSFAYYFLSNTIGNPGGYFDMSPAGPFLPDGGYDPTGSSQAGVRCVRDPSPACAPATRFTVGDAGMVRDNLTGFWWQQRFSPPTTWSGALSACSTLPLGNVKWHLPTAKELESLLDHQQSVPLDGGLFEFYANDQVPMWTSTPVSGQAGQVWTLPGQGGFGIPGFVSADSSAPYARCVHTQFDY